MRGRKFGRIGCIYERGMRRRGFGSLRSRISSVSLQVTKVSGAESL